ncbi:head decoration protein [Metasolibacillus sp. FSL H7-0170]|uniref:head decoration protein n=1 Tax=Metasolibacillus sp. FSL H7-0170 TaxID=2921431 RepID=UPI0031585756
MRVLEYENLLAGFQDNVVTEPVTVAAEQELSVGQVFALNTEGEAVAMTGASTATDVYGIMADAVATAENETKAAVCYKRGEFNARKIILPSGGNAVAYKKALSNIGITLRDTIAAVPQEEE